MAKKIPKKQLLPTEAIAGKIFFIRGQKVMIDRDLAELYGVETRTLKQAVRRNTDRFPSDFMFELTKAEFNDWRSQLFTEEEKPKPKIGYIKEKRSTYSKRIG